jgi:hypothetical protein
MKVLMEILEWKYPGSMNDGKRPERTVDYTIFSIYVKEILIQSNG